MKNKAPSHPTDARIAELADWRAATLARVRKLIHQADPQVVEVIKWRKPSNAMRGVPVWSHDGIICTGETYKTTVKLTFAKGAALDDPSGLFNASLDGNTRRAIDLHEGDKIDAKAFKALIRAAVELNTKSKEVKCGSGQWAVVSVPAASQPCHPASLQVFRIASPTAHPPASPSRLLPVA